MPSGRAGLATKPIPTGSVTTAKTTGIERLVRCSATMTGELEPRMTSGRRADHLVGVGLHAVGVPRRPADVELDVLSVDPSKLAHLLPEGRDPGEAVAILPESEKDADAPHAFVRLRVGDQRPGDRAAGEERDEIPPPHSIVSLAVASSQSDTFSPSALAVLRLMTSSKVFGAWTGRSAGFSPLRMRWI